MILLLDRAAIAGLVVGLGLYVMPFWKEGRLRVAFWVTLLATVLHIFSSRGRAAAEATSAAAPAILSPPGRDQ